MGLEVSVLLVTSLHRYRELLVLETVELRLRTRSFCVSLRSTGTAGLYCPTPMTLLLKIISVRCRLRKSCYEFPTSAASAATWEAAESTSVRAFGLLHHGDCLTGT